ncbi:spindle and kinetochore-associated protein 1 [Fopius arisanus]|uniref:SKA complex subunit 1 n=3 Tax=Fopius arisanus TaxID=64838 RepID=A0A9R1TJ32_9HYME|nr:PREDICTED: spindle and kinetochore-associated protein 1-like [Fopius arisanus]XP_011310096.1 PREDICTED: spindle and kinetochore-associated protein 1-like [Fopius arisanus]
MASIQNLEEVMEKQLQVMKQLQTVTVFLQNKEGLREALLEAQQDIEIIQKGLFSMTQALEKMKNQSIVCKELISLFTELDKKIIHMSNNVPPRLVEHFARSQPQESKAPIIKLKKTSEVKQPEANLITNDMAITEIKDCRKALFREAEDTYSIDPLTQEEFQKIPKYMIGRQTLDTVNAFVGIINQVMKAKYSLLDLGKIGARKKGELDLYLQFKKEESDVKGAGKEKIYFFTAEDYQREIKAKLDKSKLNLMTVLRHCKRIHELRTGKNVRYQVLTTR